MSNLLCQIVVLLSTNTVTHWPQRYFQDTNAQPIGANSEAIVGGRTFYIYPAWADDTNADSNSVETTVTREFWVVVPITRYWDENMKLIGEWPESRFELTNWLTMHYSVEQRRVRTNATAWVNAREIKTPDGTTYTLVADDAHARMAVTYPTNWFEPVATNDASSASVLMTSVTNYGVISWINAINITNPVTNLGWGQTNLNPKDATNSSQEHYRRKK